MRPKVIKSELEYKRALARIKTLMETDVKPGTQTGDEFELLAVVVDLYEKQTDPIEPPSPIDAILFRMEQAGLQPKDLVQFIGSRSKVSEVLNGKRPLSINMIRALHTGLGIPLEVLFQPPMVLKQSRQLHKSSMRPITRTA